MDLFFFVLLVPDQVQDSVRDLGVSLPFAIFREDLLEGGALDIGMKCHGSTKIIVVKGLEEVYLQLPSGHIARFDNWLDG
jgi:hypothetical protein